MSDRVPRRATLPVTIAVSAPLAILVTWPQLFGAQQWPVVAQLIAFRAPLAIGLALVAVIAGVVAITRRRWAVAAGLAIVMGVASVAGAGVLLARGGAGAAQASGELTVLVWNTQGGASTPGEVAQLVLDTDADIVALPEMDEDAVAQVASLLGQQGRAMSADTTRVVAGSSGESWIPTSVLIADRLGEYQRDVAAGSTPRLPSGVWRPADGSGPVIAAVHPYPPLPGQMDAWSAGLRWVAGVCDSAEVIVAGDLNATLDHLSGLGGANAELGECRDVALEAGTAAEGTWPSSMPAWLAAPIDHVLVGSAWTVRAAHVVATAGGGSDHRPLVAVLDAR